MDYSNEADNKALVRGVYLHYASDYVIFTLLNASFL
jgi:hypothetical protein